MNIQTFSQTYWYIWLLIILFLIILILLNGGGIFCYHRKRNDFLRRSNPVNPNSSLSLIGSQYKQTTHRSSPIEMSSLTITTNNQFLSQTKSDELITSTPNSILIQQNSLQSKTSLDQHTQINQSDFQHQALAEHNFVRTLHNKLPLKLTERLNISARSWADQCARTNLVLPSRLDWRLQGQDQPFGEIIISMKSTDQLNGIQFTRMISAYGEQSKEVHCLLNEISTEVGFGFAHRQGQDNTQHQWIAVAHYYPYHQLTTVQP